MSAPAGVGAGVLLPVEVLQSGPVAVLAAFVAVNTVMYAALAVAKVLPKVYPTTWFGGRNRRAQNRSIHPDDADRAAAAAAARVRAAQ
ncbi:hypothetical protein [Actinotalea solisilvae]|uniref:hypothetical protein n=1 Tax=Actinotalea solisilvae TaxID=2072922 RepID=UPI0018F13842|nr:hypothetical protein [Actinotalea solisilvae]